jgi:ABC-type bacteriocin/lantibiotic exporter with double-glycine peptidase domain
MGVDSKNTSPLKPIQRLHKMLSLDRKDIYLVVIYAFFAGLIGLALPLGIQAIINLIAIGQTTTSWLVLCFVVTIASAFVGLMKWMQEIIAETIQQRIFTRSAFEFAYRIPRFKMERIKDEYAPELANRFFDTLSIQKGIPKLVIDLPASSLQILFGLFLLALYHPFFVAFGIVLLLLLSLVIISTYSPGLKASLMESKYKYKVAYWLEELGRTMGSFKLAGRTRYPLDKTDKLVENYLLYRQKHFAVYRIQFLSSVTLRAVATLALLLIGGFLVINNQMNIGQFVAAEIVIISILNSMDKIVLTMDSVFDVLTAIEKIGMVTDVDLENDEGIDFKELVGDKGMEIKLRNLSYQPDPKLPPILKNINLDIKANENVCITGYNSSGKTTLLRILMGVYENFTGSIAYNGMPRGNLNLASLRSYMGDYVTEEHLFNETLWQNICMGRKDVSMHDILEVCDAVNLNEFLEKLPDGLDTIIPSDGQGLSQTTINRIILARCIVDHPRLVVTEPLMVTMEADKKRKLLEVLTNKNKSWTLVSVTRSASFAKSCDRVVVLNDGEIIFDGHYEDLKKTEHYNNLFEDIVI